MVEAGVVSVQGKQFVVAADFDDAAVVEHSDLVGVAHGGNPVGDEDGGGSCGIVAESAQDALFGVGIDAGQGVVEDEDGGAAQQGAGDGGALFLSAGKRDAAFADDGFKALRELLELLADVGGFGGFEHALPRLLGRAEGRGFREGCR